MAKARVKVEPELAFHYLLRHTGRRDEGRERNRRRCTYKPFWVYIARSRAIGGDQRVLLVQVCILYMFFWAERKNTAVMMAVTDTKCDIQTVVPVTHPLRPLTC